MKICKIESVRVTATAVSIYVRIKSDHRTQNAYNRFKHYLRDNLVMIKSVGYGGRSGLHFENCHVNMVKTSKYMHLFIFTSKKKKPVVIEAITASFPVILKNTTINNM